MHHFSSSNISHSLAEISQNPLFIVYLNFELGGIQTKIIDLIKFTHQKNPNRKIILCLLEKNGLLLPKIPKYVQLYRKNNITLKGFRKFNSPYSVIWLFWLIIKHHPKQILTFLNHSTFLTFTATKLIFWKKFKIIIGQDCTTSIHVSMEPKPKKNFNLIKKLYPLAIKILVQTKIQKIDLINNFNVPTKKIIISPNWLSPDFEINSQTNLNKKPIDILYIGRLDPQKNLSEFVTIIHTLHQTKKNIKVLIVGEGSEKDKLIKLINHLKLNKVIKILPGTINPQKYYSQSKIFLLTSIYEGFPLSVMEAISLNCLPVCKNIKEVAAFFNPHKNNLIYNQIDEAPIKIQNILSNPSENKKILEYYKNKIKNQQQRNLNFFYNQIVI